MLSKWSMRFIYIGWWFGLNSVLKKVNNLKYISDNCLDMVNTFAYDSSIVYQQYLFFLVNLRLFIC